MKKIMMVLSLVLVLQGCTNNLKQNEQRARAVFEAFNRHDWKAMADLYAEPAEFLDPSFGQSYVSKSRAETVEKYQGMQSMFPDIHDEVVGVYPSGDIVTVEFVSSGTSADGKTFSLPIVTVLTFKDGLVAKDATYYDNF